MATKTKTATLCGCGCETPTSSTFAPGHDARMVSKAVEATVSRLPYLDLPIDDDTNMERMIEEVATKIFDRFGGPLSAKYHEAATRSWIRHIQKVKRQEARAEAKARKAAKKAAKAGAAEYGKHADVKIGRWTYPARVRTSDGRVERNTKRDGSGDWVEYEGSK